MLIDFRGWAKTQLRTSWAALNSPSGTEGGGESDWPGVGSTPGRALWPGYLFLSSVRAASPGQTRSAKMQAPRDHGAIECGDGYHCVLVRVLPVGVILQAGCTIL